MNKDKEEENAVTPIEPLISDIPKDFSVWNEMKRALHNSTESYTSYHEREIWWCALGANIGSEDDGKNEHFERPVLIFRKFGGKISWIIPISSQPCVEDRFQCSILIQGMKRTARIHQMRLISHKRLLRYIDYISMDDFSRIRKMFADLA